MWYPIENAPKDRDIDLWCNNIRVADCRFHCNKWCYFGQTWSELMDWISVERDYGKPTHWMDIPEGPK